jgi:hypothetical protein
MSQRRPLVLLLALGLLAGCTRYVYRHPEYTAQRWNTDRYECERDARQSGYFGTGVSASIAMQEFFDRCMLARGWTKTRAE